MGQDFQPINDWSIHKSLNCVVWLIKTKHVKTLRTWAFPITVQTVCLLLTIKGEKKADEKEIE